MGKRIVRTKRFDDSLKHIKDKGLKVRIWKQIKKIIKEPSIGDFLSYERRGERKIYVGPFRLLYSYDKNSDTIYLLDFDKRDRIYKKKRK